MSRSFRRRPHIGWCHASSEKWSKRSWHRRMRAAILVALHRFDEDQDFLPHQRQVSDPWSMAKDGKVRFDLAEHPELMRK